MRNLYKVLSEKYSSIKEENDNPKVFNPQIYEIYKKALQVDNFEAFKELIKQLPDPWKYEVMVGGGANARAIIKDILKLKDIPSSYSPKTPADHFLTAVDHIHDVEHSPSATLDDIRAGYAYAQEHFAKWLEHKKAEAIHQKSSELTGGGWNPGDIVENNQARGFQNVYFWFNKILPQGWEENMSVFRKWANTQKINSDRVSSDEEFWQDYWDYKIEEIHYNLRNQGIDADITRCRDRAKEEIKNLYNQFLTSDWYKEYQAAQNIHQKSSELTGGHWNPGDIVG